MAPTVTDNAAFDEDPKLEQPAASPIDGPLNRRYAVNWSDNTESDSQYALSEIKKYMHKTKAR